jgi:serine phosphatase RsbU (regulator of sigma subunit)
MRFFKPVLLFSFLLSAGLQAYSQNRGIDSLKNIISHRNEESLAPVYLQLVMQYVGLKDLDSSIINAQLALEIATKYNQNPEKAKAYNYLGKLFNSKDKQKALEYYTKTAEVYREMKDTVKIISSTLYLSDALSSMNPNESIKYAEEALKLAVIVNDKSSIGKSYMAIGAAHYSQSNYVNALKASEKAAEVFRETGDKASLGVVLNTIGVIYKNWGDYQKAIEYYQMNLNLSESLNDTMQMGIAYANIGNIYFYVGIDLDKALYNYEKSQKFFQVKRQFINQAQQFNSMGLVYKEKKEYGEALIKFKKALKEFKDQNFKQGIASAQANIGNVYLEGSNFSEALVFINEALRINQETGNKKEVASNYRDLGRIYFKWGKYTDALQYYSHSMKINKELGYKKEVYDLYRNISEVYEKQGIYRTALDNFKNYNALKDSTISEGYLNQISELAAKYETDKKDKELIIQKSELDRKNAEARSSKAELEKKELENKRQRLLIYSFILGLIIVFVFSIILFRQYREKKRANILLEEHNIEIKHQRDQIFVQKQEITDSIHYAKRIQTAILSPDRILEKNLAEHFILYRPRDIVSGDYYWMTETGSKTIVLAADCTGHGVPGAFMSMLGVSFLNEIVIKQGVIKPSDILNELRRNIVAALHQTGKEGEAQDGMDMALVCIDHEAMQAEFAGAYNPMYLIRKNELTEYNADRMPIGIHLKGATDFTNNVLDVQKGDGIYIFSDGYIDQFGGDKSKKFMAKRFKELLLEINKESFQKQASILNSTIEKWKGNIEQIDDILVIGLKI